jgi:hypothetical protein
MKIDQHPFPTNMLDAKGKAKVLTSEAAERSASVDPQHQITTVDAKGKGLIQEGTNSGRPPRSGIVITHRRPREMRHLSINQTQVFTHIPTSTFSTTSSYFSLFDYEFLGVCRLKLDVFSSSA